MWRRCIIYTVYLPHTSVSCPLLIPIFSRSSSQPSCRIHQKTCRQRSMSSYILPTVGRGRRLFCKFFSDSDQKIQEQITFLRYVLLVYMKFMNFLSSHVLIVNFDLLVFSVKKPESKNLAKGIHLALTDDGLPKS